MNEDRWAGHYHPQSLVQGVYARWGAKMMRNERYDPERLRLFACSCLRRVWHLLDDEHRQAVVLLEKHARSSRPGGLIAARQLYRAASRTLAQEWVRRWDSAWDASVVLRVLAKDGSYGSLNWSRMRAIAGPGQADLVSRLEITSRCLAASAVWKATGHKASAAGLACTRASTAMAYWDCYERGQLIAGTPYAPDPRSPEEDAVQCSLFRDIYRRPTDGPLTVGKAVLAWQEGTVVKLARSIDQKQDWSQLPILADALEEAGADADLAAHCRSEGPHVRGCWAVDLLLKRPIC
jgi:hypothetical protein